MGYKTEQEEFWHGEFGEKYISRNDSKKFLASNIAFFSEILRGVEDVKSIVEFGANIGVNLKALTTLLPDVDCAAIEINHKAAKILKEDPFFGKGIEVSECSILEYEPKQRYDFVLIKGVLIHINPGELEAVYEKLYRSAKQYICMAEYYNPFPVTVSYRGNENRLFKRDFAGEFLERYSDVRLINYGFCYHRDVNFRQDDITWFLMEKR